MTAEFRRGRSWIAVLALGVGVLGVLLQAAPAPASRASAARDDADCAQVDYESPSLDRLRADQQRHLEGYGKFPDTIEVGSGPWEDVWEWHVRVLRQAPPLLTLDDGRYALQFRGTLVVLRPDAPANYFGLASDRP